MSDERVVVVPDDPEWPRVFDVERVLLERVLAPWFEGGIHHVGSTSIPGIAAKPLIDMIAGVRDLEEARGAFEPVGRHFRGGDRHRGAELVPRSNEHAPP